MSLDALEMVSELSQKKIHARVGIFFPKKGCDGYGLGFPLNFLFFHVLMSHQQSRLRRHRVKIFN